MKTDCDQKWVDAMKPYWGGGIVPVYYNADKSVNAERTLENFAKAHGFKKIGPNGEDLEWQQP